MYDVITVGSNTLDFFIHTDKKYVRQREYHFPIGSKILIHSLDSDTGGGGTNTAVCFARLGLKTAYCGKVGCCDTSSYILEQLIKEKIDISTVVRSSKGRAGLSIIMDAEKTDRTILAYKGLNDEFKFSELNKNKLKDTKWIYLCSFTGKSFHETEKLARFAKDNKINLAFNPSSYIAQQGFPFVKKIIDCTTALILNKEEANYLLGNNKKASIENMLELLYKKGPKIVVITDGAKGAFAYDGKKTYHSKPKKVKVVETTGAGDAFASTFIGAMIKGEPIDSALKYGQRNAESVITHLGAKNILLSWAKLKKRKR